MKLFSSSVLLRRTVRPFDKTKIQPPVRTATNSDAGADGGNISH
jgi:hypothetical protein